MTVRGLAAAALACVAVATGDAACTVLSDFDVDQCSVDADCDVLSGIRRCEQSRCVSGCASNRHCTGLDPRTPLCQRPGGQCVALVSASSDCYLSSNYDDASMGALTAEDLLVVGAFAPTFRSSLWLTLELAADEFNSSRAATGAEALPPLLVELCQDNPDRVSDGIAYLTQALGARAVLASLDDASLRPAVLASGAADGPLFLSPNGSTVNLDDFGERAERVWFLGARYQDATVAYDRTLQGVIDAALGRGTPLAELRIASLIGGAVEDSAFASAVRGIIRIGSVDADTLLADGRFKSFELPESSETARAEELARLSSFAPDVVLVFTSGVFADGESLARASVVHILEASAGPDWQPLYVFNPRNTEDVTLRRLAAANDSFRARAIGVDFNAPLESTAASAVASTFRARFPSGVTPDVNLSVSFGAYDALYYLAYSMAAASTGRTSNRAELLRGLNSVTRPGTEVVRVGAADLGRVEELLRVGLEFDLSGTRGVAIFDPETHTRASVPTLYCWSADGEVAEAAKFEGNVIVPSDTDCAGQVIPKP